MFECIDDSGGIARRHLSEAVLPSGGLTGTDFYIRRRLEERLRLGPQVPRHVWVVLVVSGRGARQAVVVGRFLNGGDGLLGPRRTRVRRRCWSCPVWH